VEDSIEQEGGVGYSIECFGIGEGRLQQEVGARAVGPGAGVAPSAAAGGRTS
jgi:hypothetical protein